MEKFEYSDQLLKAYEDYQVAVENLDRLHALSQVRDAKTMIFYIKTAFHEVEKTFSALQETRSQEGLLATDLRERHTGLSDWARQFLKYEDHKDTRNAESFGVVHQVVLMPKQACEEFKHAALNVENFVAKLCSQLEDGSIPYKEGFDDLVERSESLSCAFNSLYGSVPEKRQDEDFKFCVNRYHQVQNILSSSLARIKQHIDLEPDN